MWLIHDYGDWLSSNIAALLKTQNFHFRIINLARSNPLLRAIRLLGRLAGQDKFFFSPTRLAEFFILDIFLACRLLDPKVTGLITFKGQTCLSLFVSKTLKKPVVLIFGSEPTLNNEIFEFAHRRIWEGIEHVQLKNADIVVSESEFIRGQLDFKKCLVVNCFHFPIASRARAHEEALRLFELSMFKNYPPKGTKVGFVFGENKGADVAEELQEILESGSIAEFVIVGAPVGRFNKSTHTPRMNHQSMVAFLQEVDIMIFPTRSDAGPRLLIEAVFAGCRVVTSKFSMGPDLAHLSFVSVADRDSGSFSRAILSLNSKPDLRCYFKFLDQIREQQEAFREALNWLQDKRG